MGIELRTLNRQRESAVRKIADLKVWLDWASFNEEVKYYEEVFNLAEIDAQIIETKLNKVR